MLKQFFNSFLIISIVFTVFTNLINYANVYASTLNSNEDLLPIESNLLFVSNSENLFWPTPGYYNITSNFGERISPITKKNSFHYGIDISATQGSLIYSASDGIISYAGFNGANGYSIHVNSQNHTFIYGHVSPNYIVTIGQNIKKGEIIGTIGPKYIENIPNNPYTDSARKSN